MPIFTDNSTFPLYKFNDFDNQYLHSYECIEKRIFVPKGINFRKDFLKAIECNSKQHLFIYLISYILRLVFNVNVWKFREDEIISDSIKEKYQFLQLLNYKINLHEIVKEIDKYEFDSNVQIDSKPFINDLIVFTYKFYFVKFANVIYCHSIDDLIETMKFEEKHKIFLKYCQDIEKKNYTILNYQSKKNYVENYFKSFNSDDVNFIENTINQILLFSNRKESLLFLNEIIENRIKINSHLSQTRKNKILIPFFKLITSVFYFRENLELEIDDPILINKFKKFKLQMKKHI